MLLINEDYPFICDCKDLILNFFSYFCGLTNCDIFVQLNNQQYERINEWYMQQCGWISKTFCCVKTLDTNICTMWIHFYEILEPAKLNSDSDGIQ